MKKFMFYRLIIVVALSVIIVVSCKKDKDTHSDYLAEAKSWYQKSTATGVSVLKSNNNSIKPIRQEVEWKQAKIFKLEDGNNVVGVPITVKSGSQVIKGSFILLISQNGNTFKPTVAYSKQNNYFNASISDAEIQVMYKKAITETASHKKNNLIPNKEKVSVRPPDEGGGGQICIDWYWTTTVYDSWGNIVEYHETYLYTTCQPGDGSGGGGGGGSGDPEQENCSIGEQESQSEAASATVEEAFETVAPTTRTKTYRWKFLQNAYGLWNYTSTEKGTHKKVGSDWEWDKLEHVIHGRNGITLVASISVSDVVMEPVIAKTTAGCTLQFNFNSSFLCKGVPGDLSLSMTVNSPVWNVGN